ncbi:unnamed protein product [Blepharisma stoltei]|uniref:EF-hand domain-containing protein n=1 Tax=Blepharisma stoltei TaxID=1481888 RepID=A0AAU9KA15_9CILI|nr:unnamed protein product [Blepharisma stoltei]
MLEPDRAKSPKVAPEPTILVQNCEDLPDPDQPVQEKVPLLKKSLTSVMGTWRSLGSGKLSNTCLANLRKSVRITYITIFLFIIFISFYTYAIGSQFELNATFTDSSLVVAVHDCKIKLYKDLSLSENEVKAYVNAFRNPSNDTAKAEPGILSAENYYEDLETCEIKLTSNGIFPDITFECVHLCWIEQVDDDISFSSFTANTYADDNGNILQSRIKLKEVNTGDLSVNLSGTVTIESLTATSGNIDITDGDLWIQTPKDSYISWSTTYSGYYCFAGPSIVAGSTDECITSKYWYTNDTSYTVESCEGAHYVCSSSPCKNTRSFDVKISNGAIYWNLISGGELQPGYKMISGDEVPIVDLKGHVVIDKIANDTFNAGINKDVLAIMNMPGIYEDNGKWLFTTNEAYAQMKPWWLSLISFGLLVPDIYSINIRILPLSYPLTNTKLTNSTISTMYNTLYDMWSARDSDLLIWMETSKTSDNWYKFSRTKTLQLSKHLIKLTDNPFLLAALSISLFLGFVCGLGGAFGFYIFLKNLADIVWRKLEHKRRFLVLRNTVETRIRDNRSAKEILNELDEDDEENDENNENNENEKEEVEGNEGKEEEDQVPGEGCLLPPYAIPDILITQSSQSNADSLSLFLQKVVKEVPEGEEVPIQTLKLVDVKSKYEEFCFAKGYVEKNLKENKEKFTDLEMEFFTVNDTSTEVFRKIFFKNRKELIELGKPAQMPNEDSLSFFVRSRCNLSPFNADVIYVKDFQSEYEKFCRAEQVTDAVPITKRAMGAMGSIFERLQITHLKAGGRYRIDLSAFVYKEGDKDVSPLGKCWYCADCCVAILHVILCVWIVLPLSLTPLLTETKHAETSARNPDYILTKIDMKSAWYLMPSKFEYLETILWVMLIVSAILLVISIVELYTYYIYQVFPARADTLLAGITGYRKLSQFAHYFALLFIAGIIVMLFVNALMWFILGAVLNPDIFLPYCAGAATLIAFCLAQVKIITFMTSEIFKRVKTSVKEKLNGNVSATLESACAGLALSQVQTSTISRENRTLQVFSKTPLGGIAKSLDINHKLATALAQGDESAIKEIAIEFGIHPLIMAAIVAVIQKDNNKLLGITEQLAAIPAINISPDIAKMIVKVSLKQSDLNIRSSVKMATVQFVKMKKELLADKEIDGYNIDPRIIEALVAMSRGSTERMLTWISTSETFPKPITDLMLLIKGLIEDGGKEIVEIFVRLMTNFGNFPKDIAECIGAFCDEGYASKFQNDYSGWDEKVDTFSKFLGIQDSLPIQMIVHMARESHGQLQRLLIQVTDMLNRKYGWRLEHQTISSLFAIIHGVNIDFDELADQYDLDPEIVKSIAPIFAEKKYTEIPRLTTNVENVRDSNLISGDIIQPDSEIQAMINENKLPPAFKALAESHQPTAESMEWMAKFFKLTGEQLLGLYSIIRGANKRQGSALKEITREVVRRMRLDESFTDYLSHVTVWLTSLDVDSIREAHSKLKMQCKDLTFVAKRLIDPKDLPNGYLVKQLKLKNDDPLVRRKKALSWRFHAALCKDWCKALANKVSEIKALKVKRRIMAKGQLLMSFQYPAIFLRKIFEKKVPCDEENQRKYKSLIQASYLWQTQGTKRKENIIALARLFEVEPEMMSAWIDMVLEDNIYPKTIAMKNWLEKVGIKDVSGYEGIIQDYSNQNQIFFNAVLGFNKLARTIGVPTSFLDSLAIGFADIVSENAEIFKQFTKKFIGELGVDAPALQDSIANFVNGEISELEPLGKALSLNPDTLTTIMTIFGALSDSDVIEKVGNLLHVLRLDPILENIGKSISALAIKTNCKFSINPQGELSKKATCSEVLGQVLEIPPLVISGMIAASKLDYETMASTIIEMSRLHSPGFQIEESHCRGFISMALGQVQNIEDICSAISFDADIAEVLVTLSGNDDLNHTTLKTSSSFQKIVLKLGLDDQKAAAVVALTRSDFDHVEDIAEDLEDGGAIRPQLLKALLSIYSYLSIDGKSGKKYKPSQKTRKLKQGLPWLCKSIGLPNSNGAVVVTKLVQGDASIIGEIAGKLGWGSVEKNIYASFACLVNQNPFRSNIKSKEHNAWMAFKHLPSIVRNLSDLFKIPSKGLEILIKLARHDAACLLWLRQILQIETAREAQRFIDEYVHDDDFNDYILETEESDKSDSESSSMGSSSESSFSSTGDLDEVDSEGSILKKRITLSFDPSRKQKYMNTLIAGLNEKSLPGEGYFNEESVKLFLELAGGNLHHHDKIEEILKSLYEDLPIDIDTLKEIMALSTGDWEDILELVEEFKELEEKNKKLLGNTDTDEANEDDLFSFYGFEPDAPELEFLVKLAKGDHSCWKIESKTNQLLCTKIYHDPRLLQSLTALCSRNPHGVIETIDALGDFLEVDQDMLLILIMLSFNSIDALSSGIGPLAVRLEIDPSIAQGFLPYCYKTKESLELSFQSICERLSSPPISSALAASIFQAMSGDLDAWVQLGLFFMNLQRLQEKDESQQALLLKALQSILSKKMPYDVKENMFNDNIRMDIDLEIETSPNHTRFLEADMTNDIEASNTNSIGNPYKEALIEKIGFKRLWRNPNMRRILLNEYKKKAGGIILDLILGIGEGDVEVVPIVMRILGESFDHYEILKYLVHIFNGNSTMLFNATDKVEEYIDHNNLNIPSGLIQSLVGSVRKQYNLMAKGVTRAANSDYYKMELKENYVENAPEIMIALVQKKLDDRYRELLPFIKKFLEKLTKVEMPAKSKPGKMFLLYAMGELEAFLGFAKEEFGIPEDALKELFTLAVPKNPLNLKEFTWLPRIINQRYPKIPIPVVDSIVKLLGKLQKDLDYGRDGMGEVLFPFVDYIVSNIPKNLRLPVKPGKEKENADIIVLDAFFLVCTDPNKYKSAVLAAMPSLGLALMPNVKPETLSLLCGLVALFQSDNSLESRDKAAYKLSKTYEIDENIIAGFIALGKGDWNGLAGMAGRFCEFDPVKIQQVVTLIKRLKLIGESEEEARSGKSDLEKLKEKMDSGGDTDQIFHMLDKDHSGELDFEEFAQIMKFFDLEFTMQRLLEIFSKFDADGSGCMNVQEFDAALEYIRSEIANGAIEHMGMGKGKLIKMFLITLLILILIFAFIFLGIIGFITASKFGSAVNSLLPMGSGGVLGKARNVGDLGSKIQEIGPRINDSLAVMTVNEL